MGADWVGSWPFLGLSDREAPSGFSADTAFTADKHHTSTCDPGVKRITLCRVVRGGSCSDAREG